MENEFGKWDGWRSLVVSKCEDEENGSIDRVVLSLPSDTYEYESASQLLTGEFVDHSFLLPTPQQRLCL